MNKPTEAAPSELMKVDTPELRPLGGSGVEITPVSLGCWPIAGVSTLGVNDKDSLATVQQALASGINHLDTAYCYGAAGESENLIRKALNLSSGSDRGNLTIATKGGIHYDASGSQAQDARPKTLLSECDESLQRLGVDQVELYYLHSPDPEVPIEESAGAIAELVESGKSRSAGASNCTLDELQAFHAVCPLSAVQLPYNMLQRDIEKKTLPWCQENNIAVAVYWPLMKGLLAGKLPEDGQLSEGDSRLKYPMYQGEELEKNQAFLRQLREIAEDADKTVAQLVVNWTMRQAGITTVLCGAKRAWQIEETAGAMGWSLTEKQESDIAEALEARGLAEAKRRFE
ncbi:aldo/keto reductase [Adhaeretor mobilis]|nr:aldo/keto reductase [Adhaeretor mobilis]